MYFLPTGCSYRGAELDYPLPILKRVTYMMIAVDEETPTTATELVIRGNAAQVPGMGRTAWCGSS